MIQLEDQLAQVRREYEMLRIEFEQTLAANEQTGATIPPRCLLRLLLSLCDCPTTSVLSTLYVRVLVQVIVCART